MVEPMINDYKCIKQGTLLDRIKAIEESSSKKGYSHSPSDYQTLRIFIDTLSLNFGNVKQNYEIAEKSIIRMAYNGHYSSAKELAEKCTSNLNLYPRN